MRKGTVGNIQSSTEHVTSGWTRSILIQKKLGVYYLPTYLLGTSTQRLVTYLPL
jgi:hypothetical protein